MSTQDFMTSEGKKGGWLGRCAPAVLVLLVIGFYVYGSRPSTPLEGWLQDPAEAFKKAAAAKSAVVLAFSQEGCPPCRAMERNVLGAGPVREALVGYVPVRVDPNKEIDLAEKYAVEGTPTFIITDSEGKALARTDGFHDVDDFVSFLNRSRLLAQR